MPKQKDKSGDWIYKGGEGIWQEWVNEKTGESTIKTHAMHKVSNWDECDHEYLLQKDGTNIVCKKCGKGGKLVWGMNFLKDGKIVSKL